MIPPSDLHADQRALTPEERELAQRLGRLGPNGEPSPALDARILAAAHDAVARTPARRPRRRWPVALGIAASLALAIGVAWRLRPLPDTRPAYRSEIPAAAITGTSAEAVDSSAAMATAAAPDDTTPPPQADTTEVASVPQPPVAAEEIRQAARTASPAAAPAPPAPADQAPPAEPDVIFDRVSSDATASPPPPAPRAFEAAPAPAEAAAAKAGVRRDAAAPQSAAAMANAASSPLPETNTLDRLQAGGAQPTTSSDEPGSDVPPATMASPAARDAWLARIRELVAAGKVDAARASLGEFTHRYPDYPLPSDLRALGQ